MTELQAANNAWKSLEDWFQKNKTPPPVRAEHTRILADRLKASSRLGDAIHLIRDAHMLVKDQRLLGQIDELNDLVRDFRDYDPTSD